MWYDAFRKSSGGDFMKKVLRTIFDYLWAFVFSIAFFVFLIFLLPVDYIRYKRSAYYRQTHKKYQSYIASNPKFAVHNDILENNLPIQYIENVNNPGCGWFVFGNTLIIVNAFSFKYDSTQQKWGSYDGEDEQTVLITLEEYIELDLEDFNTIAGQTPCTEAVVLARSKDIEDIEAAKTEPRFLIYDKDRAEVLKKFCHDKLKGERNNGS